MLIRGTLYRDDVNGDVDIACQQLHKFQAMEYSKDMFQTAVEGKGSTETGQEKFSTVADSRVKTNQDEILKEQVEVKELCNVPTDSFGDFNLGQNGCYQSNREQFARPTGEFRERTGEEPREGLRGGLAQGDSNTQGFKGNDMGMSQGWGVGLGHSPKPKTKTRGRGRGRGRGFGVVNQLDGDNSVGVHPSKRGQGNQGKPGNSGNRGRGQTGTRHPQNLSSSKNACHLEAIEQSRFQQNQLLVSGLSASTTEDCLMNFIEAMSGGEVEDIMMRNDKALITMANDITGKPCQGVTSRFI